MPRTRPPYPEAFRREAIRLPSWAISPGGGWRSRWGSQMSRCATGSRRRRPRGVSARRAQSDEREELARLRDENATLRMEREILPKAAVFFARESDGR